MNAEKLDEAREQADAWLRKQKRKFDRQWYSPIDEPIIIEGMDGTSIIPSGSRKTEAE